MFAIHLPRVNLFLVYSLFAGVFAGWTGTALGANGADTWSGATAAWNTAANWTSGSINKPPMSGDSLVFGVAGAGGLNLNNDLTSGSFSIAGLTFNSGAGAFVIGDGTTALNVGNTFVLTGNIANNSTSLETINNPFSMTAARTFTTTAGGGDITLGGNISGTGGAITKAGAGTLTLKGANTYDVLTTVQGGGTLKLMGATGSLSSSSGLFLGVSDTTYAGGSSFIYDNAGASGATAQTLATLASQNSQPNDNTVQITRTVAQPITLTFTAVTINNTENGNVINFVTKNDVGDSGANGTDYKIILGGGLSALLGSGGSSYYRIINQNAYFNGGDIAVYDPAGYVRGVNYGVDANSATSAGTTFVATDNQQITASVSGQGSITLGSGTSGHNGTLKIVGSSDLTLTSGATLTLYVTGNTGSGGILKTGGGTATISGGSAVDFKNTQADIRVDTAADVLNINIPITLDPKVRFLKSGAGTLALNNGSFSLIGNASNNGTTAHINGGILEIGGSATITPNALNTGTKGAFSVASGARIRHNSTSTSSSIASVIRGQGGVTVSAGTLTLNGANTFAGQLTVESGTLAVATMNNVSTDGPLGNSGKAVILGKSGSTGTLQYTGASASSTKPFTIAAGGTGVFQVDTGSTILTLSGVIDGSGGLTKTGPGTLTLNTANTYSGSTTINAGTLALGSSGLINNSVTNLINAGGTLDVSAIPTFTLSSSTVLAAKGTGTSAGSTEALLKGGTTVDLGSRPLELTWGGASSGTDTAHPTLVVSPGALTLNNNPIHVVNNAGAALDVGVYNLVQVGDGSGTISQNGSPSYAVTVTGTGGGLMANRRATVTVSSGYVIMTVVKLPTKLAYTTVPGTGIAGTAFSVTVEAQDDSGACLLYTSDAADE